MTIAAKDPADVLDYTFAWRPDASELRPGQEPFLAAGETITAYTVTVPAGITKDSDALDGDNVVVWLSGGTAGARYTLTCRITTSLGRAVERSMVVRVAER